MLDWFCDVAVSQPLPNYPHSRFHHHPDEMYADMMQELRDMMAETCH